MESNTVSCTFASLIDLVWAVVVDSGPEQTECVVEQAGYNCITWYLKLYSLLNVRIR